MMTTITLRMVEKLLEQGFNAEPYFFLNSGSINYTLESKDKDIDIEVFIFDDNIHLEHGIHSLSATTFLEVQTFIARYKK